MNKGNDDLEHLDPETGMKLYLDHKATDCTKSTVQNHRYRMKPFIQWCEEQGIDNLNDLSGRDIQEYRLWRNDDSDINALTLRMQMSTLRVFLIRTFVTIFGSDLGTLSFQRLWQEDCPSPGVTNHERPYEMGRID